MTETRALPGKEQDLLDTARDRFDRAYQVDQENRDEARNDLEFLVGEQWPESIRTEREQDERPVITINRMPQFVNQVTGDIRQNRPSIKIRPWDDRSDPDVAEVYTGLVRAIESQSDAEMAYQVAADAAAACGISALRVLNDYLHPESFDQDLLVAPIENPFAVYWDPASKEPTRKDANWCFVTEELHTADFEEQYPDAAISDFEGMIEGERLNQWVNQEHVRIAEYWWKKPIKKLIGETEDGGTLDVTGLDPEMMAYAGVTRYKEIDSHEVWFCKLSGAEIIEEPKQWPGVHIPIVAVIGSEIHLGERVVRHGVIRYAKDAQRLYNYSRSTHAEVVSLQPKAPFIVTPGQVEGHEDQWENANRKNYPYLLANADPMSPGFPQRATPPLASQGLTQEIALAAEDMKATTGIFDAGLGAQSNETSGRAIRARQMESDVSTSAFPDNLARSVRQIGRILVELIPHFYDKPRIIRILNEDDTEKTVVINEIFADRDPKTGEQVHKLFDMSIGKYDVVVATGPSFSTRRQEAAESMLAFVQSAPNVAGVVMDLIAKNMDWPGADEMAERLRKTLPPGMAEDEDQEGQPNQQEMMQAMMMQMQQMAQQMDQQLEAGKREAETQKAIADAEKTRAETESKEIENAQKTFELSAQMGNQDVDDLMRRLEAVERFVNIVSQPEPQAQPAF